MLDFEDKIMYRNLGISVLFILVCLSAGCSPNVSINGNWKSVEIWDGEKWMRPSRESDSVILGFSSGSGFNKVGPHPKDEFSYTLSADRTPPEIQAFAKDHRQDSEIMQFDIKGDQMTVLIYSNSKGIVVKPDFDEPPKEAKAIRFARFTGQVE